MTLGERAVCFVLNNCDEAECNSYSSMQMGDSAHVSIFQLVEGTTETGVWKLVKVETYWGFGDRGEYCGR